MKPSTATAIVYKDQHIDSGHVRMTSMLKWQPK